VEENGLPVFGAQYSLIDEPTMSLFFIG